MWAWQWRGQRFECQLAMTLVASTEARQRPRCALCCLVPAAIQSCRPASVTEHWAAWCDTNIDSIKWPLCHLCHPNPVHPQHVPTHGLASASLYILGSSGLSSQGEILKARSKCRPCGCDARLWAKHSPAHHRLCTRQKCWTVAPRHTALLQNMC